MPNTDLMPAPSRSHLQPGNEIDRREIGRRQRSCITNDDLSVAVL